MMPVDRAPCTASKRYGGAVDIMWTCGVGAPERRVSLFGACGSRVPSRSVTQSTESRRRVFGADPHRTDAMPEWSDIPSGAWQGTAYHWLLHRKGFRSNLYLWLREDEFWGYGMSPDGTFTVQGTCKRQNGLVQFTMRYRAGHEVTYYGYYDGCVIRGIWHVLQSGINIVGDFQFQPERRSDNGGTWTAQAIREPPWKSDCPHCGAPFSLRPKQGYAATCTLCRRDYDPLGSPRLIILSQRPLGACSARRSGAHSKTVSSMRIRSNGLANSSQMS